MVFYITNTPLLLNAIKGHFVLNQKFKLTLLVTQYLSVVYVCVDVFMCMNVCRFVIYYLLQTLIFATLFYH